MTAKPSSALLQQAKRARNSEKLSRLLGKAACEMDDPALEYLLLTKKAVVTPYVLQELARTGQTKWVKQTMTQIDHNARHDALMWAASKGHLETCQELLKGLPHNSVPTLAVRWAIRAGKKDIVGLLIPYIKDDDNMWELWQEASKSNVEIFSLFEPMMEDEDKANLFPVTVKAGTVDVAKHLLPFAQQKLLTDPQWVSHVEEAWENLPDKSMADLLPMLAPLVSKHFLLIRNSPLRHSIFKRKDDIIDAVKSTNNPSLINAMAVLGCEQSLEQGWQHLRDYGTTIWNLRQTNTSDDALSLIEYALLNTNKETIDTVFETVNWNDIDLGAAEQLARDLPKDKGKRLTAQIIVQQRQELAQATDHGGSRIRATRKI